MKRLAGFRFDGKRGLAHFEVILPGTKGKGRRRKTEAASDFVDATTKYHAFRRLVLDAGLDAPTTLEGYVEKHGEAIQARVSPRTAARERDHLRVLLAHFGRIPLRRISAASVKDFVAAMQAEGYHATTINNAYAVLRKYLRDAVDRAVLDVFPIRGRARDWHVREPRLRLELTETERTAFLAAFDDETGFREEIARARRNVAPGVARHIPPDWLPEGDEVAKHFERFRRSRLLFVLALETGLSRGDLFALRWDAVDSAKGLIRVTRAKTGREALVPISAALRPALKELRAQRLARRDDRELVLGLYSEMAALRYFATAKKLAGITRRLRFHDLRHSFASRHVSKGTALEVVKEMLGHASIKTTERYSRVTEDAIREAGAALDSKLLNSEVNSGTSAASGGTSDAGGRSD
jgi:site-specific recombinase XerD